MLVTHCAAALCSPARSHPDARPTRRRVCGTDLHRGLQPRRARQHLRFDCRDGAAKWRKGRPPADMRRLPGGAEPRRFVHDGLPRQVPPAWPVLRVLLRRKGENPRARARPRRRARTDATPP
eukprot:3297395-Prymnesium_polylepis.1